MCSFVRDENLWHKVNTLIARAGPIRSSPSGPETRSTRRSDRNVALLATPHIPSSNPTNLRFWLEAAPRSKHVIAPSGLSRLLGSDLPGSSAREKLLERLDGNLVQRLVGDFTHFRIGILEQQHQERKLFVRARSEAALRREKAHVPIDIAALEEIEEWSGSAHAALC